MFSLDWAFRFVPQQEYERNNNKKNPKFLFYNEIYAFRNDEQIDIKIILIFWITSVKKTKEKNNILPYASSPLLSYKSPPIKFEQRGTLGSTK